jgi:hypothetical protein
MDRMSWLFREPPHDPALAAVLRDLEAESPGGDADVLRSRIVNAAAPKLIQLRSPAPRWWEWISHWMPVALPVGLAVSLAAGLLLPSAGDLVNVASSSADAGADSTLVIAAFSEGSAGGELAGHLVAPASGDWLFEQAVSR